MQIQTKQRLIGGLVILIIVAVSLPLLFYHPLPGIHSKSFQSDRVEVVPSSDSAPLVYNLSLQQTRFAKEANAEMEQDELVSSHSLSDEELRFRASETTQISKRLLHSATIPPEVRIKEKMPPPLATKKVQPAIVAVESIKKVSASLSLPDLPKAWVVQVGSFSSKSNAMVLVHQLRSMQLDAYIRRSRLGATKIMHVFVGPYIERDAAKALQETLKQKWQLAGVIKKYTVK